MHDHSPTPWWRSRGDIALIGDIDDTVAVVQAHQQLALFKAHYEECCFLPTHVYDTATCCPVAVLLRPGRTPPVLKFC